MAKDQWVVTHTAAQDAYATGEIDRSSFIEILTQLGFDESEINKELQELREERKRNAKYG